MQKAATADFMAREHLPQEDACVGGSLEAWNERLSAHGAENS